jgi:uncharacterized glyoxalase superfamily protein PhnB
MNIIPHLNFNGQCKEAFDFYAKLLDWRNQIQYDLGRDARRNGQSVPTRDQESDHAHDA